jgi:hypothetical protein
MKEALFVERLEVKKKAQDEPFALHMIILIKFLMRALYSKRTACMILIKWLMHSLNFHEKNIILSLFEYRQQNPANMLIILMRKFIP